MSDKTTEDILNQQEAEHAIKNYTRVPNMLVDGYEELHPQDKWLFVCLVRLCGKDHTRFLSLRYISKRTGFTPSVLGDNKKDGKPGMISRLHNAGVIHAEIKRKKLADGSEVGNEQYHITITDTWALNFDFYNKSKCSESEQVIDEDSQPVRNQNKSVRNQDRNSKTCSEKEQACSDSSTNLILHSKTTDSNKITKEEGIASNDALTLLQEITNRFGGVEQVLSLLENLSTQTQQLPTSNTQDNASAVPVGGNSDKPTNTQADKQPSSYSHPATKNESPAIPVLSKETNKRPKKDATQDLTLQGSHIIEVYEAFKKRKITRNAGNVKAANGLGDVVESDQDLNEVLTLMANDKFLKDHSVRIDLDFVYRKYDGFLDRVDKLREQAKKRTSGNNNYPDMSNSSIEETDPYVLATMRSAGRLLAAVN